MTSAYKITHLPEGYSNLAIAAWKSLNDFELHEIQGRLVFTDSITEYLLGTGATSCCAHEFSSHAEFEKWLLDAVAEWIRSDPSMIELLDGFLKLA